MADDKARIQASLEGADQVAGEAKKIEGALTGAGSKIESKLGGALKEVGRSLGGVIQTGLTAAGVLQTLSLAKGVEEAKRFDEATARFGQAAGVGAERLRAQFEGLESRLLTSAPAMADFGKALGRTTYDAKGSAEALEGLGQWALATGQTLDEQLDLGKTLRSSLNVVGDTTDELGRLREMAEQVGTVGGPLAFIDTLKALGPMLQGVAADADGTKHKTEALIAVLTKGLSPAAAQRVGNAVDSTLRGKALDIERVTGHRVLNDNNELINAKATLQDLKRLNMRHHGGRVDRRSLINTYGADLGLAIYRTNLDEVDKVAQAKNSGKTAQEAEAFRKTEAAKRIDAQIQKDRAMRKGGEKLLGIHDTLVDTLGMPGALIAEFVGGQLGVKLGGAALKAGGSAAAGTLGVTGALGVAGMAAGAGAVLYDIGQDREEMGKDWRKGHAGTIGAEMAQKAQSAGEITPEIYGLAHGDHDAVKAMLQILAERQKEEGGMSPALANQIAAGMAAEFGKVLASGQLILKVQETSNANFKGQQGNPG